MKLHPELLSKHQKYVRDKTGANDAKPVFLVFHGGSGSDKKEYLDAISFGVVKVNMGRFCGFSRISGPPSFSPRRLAFLIVLMMYCSDNSKDTDMQYAYTEGIRDYMISKKDYVGSQVGYVTTLLSDYNRLTLLTDHQESGRHG